MSRKLTLMRMGQYCTTHLCNKCPIREKAEAHNHGCPECLRIPEIAEAAEMLIMGVSLRDDFTHGNARYTIYDRKTDEAICYDATARECARKMKITLESFYTFYSRQKSGSDKGSQRWEIVRVDKD